MSRFNDFVYPVETRFGAALGAFKQYLFYLSYKRYADTASDNTGVLPQIYNDNVGIIAGGMRIFPIKNVPWFFYTEYGLAYKIGNETTYSSTKQDLRGGTTYSGLWGANAAYNTRFVTEFKPWSVFYKTAQRKALQQIKLRSLAFHS